MPGTEETRSQPPTADSDTLVKALEAELILKRAGWQSRAARRGVWRALSILFLFAVLLGALLAYFYLVPKPTHRGTEAPGGEVSPSSR